ncbi:MAG: hypothetical protein GX091_10765 [Peptococcaceae bacterium]|nr:hypothetical protein [Peptococcaceae bacterium]
MIKLTKQMNNCMTKQKTVRECAHNCIYAIDGVCRLEYMHGPKQPECPYKEGNQAVTSVL